MATAAAEQLSLAIEVDDPATALARIAPMKPLTGEAPFDDEAWFFEPWWPGTPVLAYLAGGRLRLQIDHLADADSAFPELRGLAQSLDGTSLVIEGTLLVLDDEGRPDSELLRQRLAGTAGATGTEAPAGWPALVCSDLLHRDGRSLLSLPFAGRRAELGRVVRDGDACVVSRGLRGEGTTLAEAVASMGLTEIGARRLSARYRPGVADGAWLRLPVAREPAAVTRPLLALLQRLPL